MSTIIHVSRETRWKFYDLCQISLGYSNASTHTSMNLNNKNISNNNKQQLLS